MSTQPLKLISLNIEKHKHISPVLNFLKQENSDVICLQEIFVETFEMFKKELGMQGEFTKQVLWETEDKVAHEEGVAILTRFPITNSISIPYTPPGSKNSLPLSKDIVPTTNQKDKGFVNEYRDGKLLVVDIKAGDKIFKFATTHFTWGYYGRFDKEKKEFVFDIVERDIERQMKNLQKLLAIFDELGELVFTADLNAPRGEKVFDTLAQKLKDNIPEHYKTSIDASLHQAGTLPLMVDGLFTTPGHEASNVTLKSGVSDHLAVVANIDLLPKRQTTTNTVVDVGRLQAL